MVKKLKDKKFSPKIINMTKLDKTIPKCQGTSTCEGNKCF